MGRVGRIVGVVGTSVWCLAACGTKDPPPGRVDAGLPDAGDAGGIVEGDAGRQRFDRPITDRAIQMYGLQVGARWVYLRTGDELRWKEITACEDVLVLDPLTGMPHLARAYVRENRSVWGTTSVHYLVADETGVHRVRRDDVDSGSLTMFATYDPPSPRLHDGPYRESDEVQFSLETGEFDPLRFQSRGHSATSAIDTVLGEQTLAVAAGDFLTVGIVRQWDAFNAHNVQSFYATGVGEVREETTWPTLPMPTRQIEELVAHTPGYGGCVVEDGSETLEVRPCDEPLAVCDDAWGSGAPGCTDPRVDSWNCGACGERCDSGVCAGGQCQQSACDVPCEGTTICCPRAWQWGTEGCTSPGRDRWNCGGCGVECASGLICQQGECVCAEGTRDCTGDGSCQSVLDDPNNCGECGLACKESAPRCDKGVCVASCLSVDLTTCGTECVDLQWNNENCGSCGQACGDGTGTTSCVQGECVPCETAGLTDCAGDCADLRWSDKHCGSCDVDCASDEVCVFGTCVGGDGTCPEGCTEPDQICCGGICADPRTNDHHCGGCGVDVCAGGCTEACRDGECTPVDCGGGDD